MGQGAYNDHVPLPDLGDFWCDICRFKIWILTGIVLGFLIALIFIQIAIPHSRAEAIIAPAVPMSGGATSKIIGNEDAFALRFLFQHVTAGQGSDFQRFEIVLTGVSAATILLRDPRLMGGLQQDRAFIWGDNHSSAASSAEHLSAYLKRRVKIEPLGVSSGRKIVYAHPDPDFAKYMLGALHHIADGLIRKSVREEARARVEYLSEAMAQTGNAEHRRALTELLMEQERLLMLVSIDQPYAATIIEQPSASIKPVWPDIPLISLVFSIVGGVLGYILAGMRPVNRVKRESVAR